MIAEPCHTYAQIIDDVIGWKFTSNELPEWNNDDAPAIDITGREAMFKQGYRYDPNTCKVCPPVGPTQAEVAKQQLTVIKVLLPDSTEDVIKTLVAKSMIKMTDLPQSTQDLMSAKAALVVLADADAAPLPGGGAVAVPA